MATTGFWPVKGRLKDVLDYAENPDKTIARRYLDDDLAQALRYVENPEKTDQQMYTIDWQRFSVKAKNWERAVRLDRMGYSKESIQQRLRTNLNSVGFLNRWNSNLPYRPKGFPLLRIEQRIGFEITHCKRAEVVS